MAYIKLRSGREFRGWKAGVIAAPYVVIFSIVWGFFALMCLPALLAGKLLQKMRRRAD